MRPAVHIKLRRSGAQQHTHLRSGRAGSAGQASWGQGLLCDRAGYEGGVSGTMGSGAALAGRVLGLELLRLELLPAKGTLGGSLQPAGAPTHRLQVAGNGLSRVVHGENRRLQTCRHSAAS